MREIERLFIKGENTPLFFSDRRRGNSTASPGGTLWDPKVTVVLGVFYFFKW
jgi:hypothetical protein